MTFCHKKSWQIWQLVIYSSTKTKRKKYEWSSFNNRLLSYFFERFQIREPVYVHNTHHFMFIRDYRNNYQLVKRLVRGRKRIVTLNKRLTRKSAKLFLDAAFAFSGGNAVQVCIKLWADLPFFCMPRNIADFPPGYSNDGKRTRHSAQPDKASYAETKFAPKAKASL